MAESDHEYYTRHTNSMKPVCHGLERFHLSPQYIEPKIYNKLPIDIKSIDQTCKYRISPRSWFRTQSFYSINEYLDRLSIVT